MNMGILRLFSQMGVFLLFFLVPLLDLFRIDFEKMRFYILRQSFSFSDGYIFLISVLLLVFTFVGISKWFGRQFCGWMCPHNTFSVNISKLNKSAMFKDKKGLGKLVDTVLSIIFAPVIAFSMISYFFSPLELLSQIAAFEFKSWAMGAYLLLTVFFFVMINRLRSNFCRSACPYGIFQMILSDKNSKMGNVKNMFRGAGLAILIIVVSLFSILAYTVFTTKGFAVTLEKQIQGIKQGENYLFSYALDIQNDSNQEHSYKLTLDGVPENWNTELQKEVKIKSQSSIMAPILFHIDQASLNKNYSFQLTIENDQGTQIIRKITIFPTARP